MTRRMIRTMLTAAVALGGCYAAPATVRTPPPLPAAPSETAPPQPGPTYVWIPGAYAWQRSSGAYVWIPGHWTVPPTGHVWVPGHWETRQTGTVWVDGQWRRS